MSQAEASRSLENDIIRAGMVSSCYFSPPTHPRHDFPAITFKVMPPDVFPLVYRALSGPGFEPHSTRNATFFLYR